MVQMTTFPKPATERLASSIKAASTALKLHTQQITTLQTAAVSQGSQIASQGTTIASQAGVIAATGTTVAAQGTAIATVQTQMPRPSGSPPPQRQRRPLLRTAPRPTPRPARPRCTSAS